ncbi:XRE family transcriptional regulator [Companilactobacillus zhachilii]|uniref:XRE family transcriptional regulator n=1 Tax=Companilactobacillus zhachilii TaxID=2304606 RepID=A0A386PU80_9LACO|nr:helix-turn-helix transcriptional regulator [Companilactobacillus zhachilii]AYE38435.1 XRE family transcriptional regulator [Companilactobacillus zhachilii]
MFSNRLKDLRNNKHRTQKEIAKDLGVAPTTYASWEQGKREPDQAATLKIANYYGVTLDYLYGRNQTPDWATKKDVIDFKDFLDQNLTGGMAFNGEGITEEENERVKIALTQIFWERLKKIKKREGRDGNDKH